MIRRIAVLGSGVMGAQIAAHFVNAGFEVILYDLPASPQNKNLLVNEAIQGLSQLKPEPLVDPSLVRYIQAANYDDDLEALKSCDLIIEAIAERFDWKVDLYKKIKSYIHPHAILASNTSGLSIESLAKELPSALRSRFLGVHFFNPPRYMSLVELVPNKATDPQLVDDLETFLTSSLGKNIVRAKDTPNFIGNRIGIFALLNALHHAEQFDLRLDVVDALTGPIIGHPKSATLRTLDIVGLDTFAHVVKTMANDLPDDPWRELFVVPAWMQYLIDRGSLGQKAGIGIFKKEGKELSVFDIKENDYRPMTSQANKDVLDMLKIKESDQKFKRLYDSKKADAQFLWSYHRDLWHYAAYHLSAIADNARDVDEAMRWGFAWDKGPFELWQQSNWSMQAKHMAEDIAAGKTMASVPLPEWVGTVKEGCYSGEGAYSPATNAYEPKRLLPVYQRRESVATTLFENAYVRLWQQSDAIGILSFKSKLASISKGVLDGIRQALVFAEKNCDAMVIWQSDSPHFSVGADITEFLASMNKQNYAAINQTLEDFQGACLALRYSPIPVVAAVKGYALGGGCELALHCDARVAHIESYMGLVEAGVGLLPGGGGTKEMARIAAIRARDKDPLPYLKPLFENLAMARASQNAYQARDLCYLKDSDPIIMHPDELLYAAKQTARYLVDVNYCPPRPDKIKVVGEEGFAQLEAMLINLLEGEFISEHDYMIANTIAQVICGGMVNANSRVDEDWILRLEREGFVELAQTPQSKARIEHMLTTGKPLRN